MQYALLFYVAPGSMVESLPPAERTAWFARMGAWREDAVRAGAFRAGTRLDAANTAASLRRDGGKVLALDGPFAETKEVLTGLVLLECVDRDAALAWAERCPILEIGTIEVRPEFPAPR